MDLDEKRCSTCKLVKPLTAFEKSKRNASGRGSRCLKCNGDRRAAWALTGAGRESKKRRDEAYRARHRRPPCVRSIAPKKQRKPRVSAEERFWSKVDTSGTCWLWTAGTDRKGYGRINWGGKSKEIAPRVSWMLCRGPIPDGMCVLHNCPGGDNPGCVNPDHLFLGTRAVNNADMSAKHRVRHGEQHPRARLTQATVDAIRRDYVPYQFGYVRLAAKYGLRESYVIDIVKGRAWRHP